MLILIIKRVHTPFLQKYKNAEVFEINPELSHGICW